MKKRFSLVLDPQSIYDVIDQNIIRSDLYQCHLAAKQLQLRILKVIIYIGLNAVLYSNWARFQFERKYLHKPCCQNGPSISESLSSQSSIFDAKRRNLTSKIENVIFLSGKQKVYISDEIFKIELEKCPDCFLK